MTNFTGTITEITESKTSKGNTVIDMLFDVDGTELLARAWKERADALIELGVGAVVTVSGYIAGPKNRFVNEGMLSIKEVSPKTPADFGIYEGRALGAGEMIIISEGPNEHAKRAIAVVLEEITAEDMELALRDAQSFEEADWYDLLAHRGKLLLAPAREIFARNPGDLMPVLNLVDDEDGFIESAKREIEDVLATPVSTAEAEDA